MPTVSLRDRVADGQRLLSASEWPPWVRHGVPAVAVLLGAVAMWDENRRDLFPHGSNPSVQATVLIGLSILPWVLSWHPAPNPQRAFIVDHPLAFAVAVMAPLAILNLAGDALDITTLGPSGPQMSLMILLLLIVQTITHAPWWVVGIVVLTAVGIILGRAVLATTQGSAFEAWLVAAVVVSFGGLGLRANFLTLQRLRDARDELARQAVAEDRRRVAREVHDVVAHTLSVTMLHLTAARLAVDRAPERAIKALEEAERQGRAGMGDIRRMVRLLHAAEDGDGNGAPPPGSRGTFSAGAIAPALPTLDELPDLVATYEAAGLGITTDIGLDPNVARPDGARSQLSPAIGLAMYRVAQESLANASRHGSGSAHLRMWVDVDAVTLTVRNPVDGTSSDGATGTGVIGMRERVRGLGGSFRAGPIPPDGVGPATWEVEAHLPVGAEP